MISGRLRCDWCGEECRASILVAAAEPSVDGAVARMRERAREAGWAVEDGADICYSCRRDRCS